jgi:hypothetical protein
MQQKAAISITDGRLFVFSFFTKNQPDNWKKLGMVSFRKMIIIMLISFHRYLLESIS